MLRRLHGVLLHAARRLQLRLPRQHVRRRLVAVQLRRDAACAAPRTSATTSTAASIPGAACPGGCHCGERRLHQLQDLLRRLPLRAVQHADRGRHADHVPARHVRAPVPDRLPELPLSRPRTTSTRARTRRGACDAALTVARGGRDPRARAARVRDGRAAAEPRRDPAPAARRRADAGDRRGPQPIALEDRDADASGRDGRAVDPRAPPGSARERRRRPTTSPDRTLDGAAVVRRSRTADDRHARGVPVERVPHVPDVLGRPARRARTSRCPATPAWSW